MRQKSQSIEDAQFRTALENMRYAQCTQDDIDFLNTRIAGKSTVVFWNARVTDHAGQTPFIIAVVRVSCRMAKLAHGFFKTSF